MSSRRIWVLWLAAMVILFSVSCWERDSVEVVKLRNAVDSLQQEVDALREDLAQRAEDADPPAEDASAQVTALTEAVGRVAQAAEGLEKSVEALSGTVDAQLARIADLEAQIDAIAAELRANEETFTLQLLHASDMDDSIEALTNIQSFSAALDAFRRQFPDNTIVLSSGDNYRPGPRYHAAADSRNAPALGAPGAGRADIALLNAMGFQASAVGSHDLDRGAEAFAEIISADSGEGGLYPGAAFPYLSANLAFDSDEHLEQLVAPGGQDAALMGGSLARSAVVAVGGERVGVVGASSPLMNRTVNATGISVLPAEEDDVDGLAAIIQREVDALVAQGINKVVLLSYMRNIDVEKELAARLVDVDIIVAGGSNAILADDTDRLRPGDEAADAYPLLLESPSGEPVLLVNTDGGYRYLGRLVVKFDPQGLALPDSIDPYVSGAYATDTQGGQAFPGRPIPEVDAIVESLRSVLQSRDGNILGRTSVYMAGDRGDVRTQETNLGNLTADAILWYARLYDPDAAVSIKNGGGIRGSIGLKVQTPGAADPGDVTLLPPQANPDAGKAEGDVSQFDVEVVATFDNGLVIVPLTARQLVEVVEGAIGFEGVGEAAWGQFPQVGGMRFSFDPAAPSGERVRSLAIVDDEGAVVDRVVEDGALSGDPDRPIKVVSLDYLANRGNGYPFPVPAEGRVDLAGESNQFNAPDPHFPDTNGNGVLDEPVAVDPGLVDFAVPGAEQDAVAEYLAHFHAETPFNQAETPPVEDRRIQNLGVPDKQDTVFDEEEA